MTKTFKLLQAVAKSPAGMTMGEMKKFVVELNGLDWEEKVPATRYVIRLVSGFEQPVCVDITLRKYRGYWSDRFKFLIAHRVIVKEGKRYILNCILGEGGTAMSLDHSFTAEAGRFKFHRR